MCLRSAGLTFKDKTLKVCVGFMEFQSKGKAKLIFELSFWDPGA